jgi:hypothetical protein
MPLIQLLTQFSYFDSFLSPSFGYLCPYPPPFLLLRLKLHFLYQIDPRSLLLKPLVDADLTTTVIVNNNPATTVICLVDNNPTVINLFVQSADDTLPDCLPPFFFVLPLTHITRLLAFLAPLTVHPSIHHLVQYDPPAYAAADELLDVNPTLLILGGNLGGPPIPRRHHDNGLAALPITAGSSTLLAIIL